MAKFLQVGDSARADRVALAKAVRLELTRAGLPLRSASDPAGPGADIEIDMGDDEAGGVFVTWHADGSLTLAAAQSVSEGRFDDEVIRRSGVISEAMRDSIIAILNAANLVAVQSDDDMRPLALRVVAAAH